MRSKDYTEWNDGAQCEIYSHSNKQWVSATVLSVYPTSDDVKWAVVDYRGTRQRFRIGGRDVRLPSHDRHQVMSADIASGSSSRRTTTTRRLTDYALDEESDALETQYVDREAVMHWRRKRLSTTDSLMMVD